MIEAPVIEAPAEPPARELEPAAVVLEAEPIMPETPAEVVPSRERPIRTAVETPRKPRVRRPAPVEEAPVRRRIAEVGWWSEEFSGELTDRVRRAEPREADSEAA